MSRTSFQSVQEVMAPTFCSPDLETHDRRADAGDARQIAPGSSLPSLASPFIVAGSPSKAPVLDTTSDGERQLSSSSSAEVVNSSVGAHATAKRFVRERTVLPTHQTVFKPLQQWEGVVVSTTDQRFAAILQDLTNASLPKERADFSFDEVEPEDRSLIAEGAVFYWSVGYEITPYLQRKHAGLIRFRRLPAWTRDEIQAVKRHADEMEIVLGLRSSTDNPPKA